MRVPGSLEQSDDTVVGPEFVLLRRETEGYSDARLGPGDTHLLIEVAEASLMRDREVKAMLYANAGIVDY